MPSPLAVAGSLPAAGEAAQWGSTLDWAITLTIVLSAAILVYIVLARVVYRAHQTEGSALWLHLAGLGILPLFLLVVGNFATLEYSKEVQFCGACHLVMKPYIDDLHDPQSTSLTAVHFQHRFAPGTECYSCHANYGPHGTAEAKLIGLRHVFKYWTGTYRLPLKLPAPFDNALCLKCHDGAKRFVAEDLHLDDGATAPALLSNAKSCGRCHKNVHAVPKSQQAMRTGDTG